MSQPTTDTLLEDLRQVVHDAEELLKATAGQAGEHIAQARAKAEASLRSAKAQLAGALDCGTASVREVAGRADTYVRNSPWLAIGAGAVVGLLVGMLVGRQQGGSK